MSVYPYNLTPEGAPTDATGSCPMVAGYTPMTTGRRVAIVLVDGVIGGAVGGLTGVSDPAGERLGSAGGAIGISVIFGLVTLWAVFGRSARLAGLLMKAQYVDVRTGALKGGSLFLKQLLQGVLAGVTFGIAPLVLVFASVQGPMRRNFFDRATKLMLVDGRSGRRPGSPPEAAVSPQATSHVAAVQFHPEQAPTAWGAPGSTYEFPAVATITDDGGLITAVPGSGSAPTAGDGVPSPAPWPAPGPIPAAPHPAMPAPAAAPLPAAAQAPLPTPAAPQDRPASAAPWPQQPAEEVFFARPSAPQVTESDRTVLAPSSLDGASTTSTTPEVTLDGEHALLVGPPLVFGRNPVAPGSHPDAVAHRLEDSLLSKTHLLVGRDEEGVWVIDLNSTNGSRVAKVPEATPRLVEPGRRVRLPEGASVHFGQHRITVG
ncbi:FHA domain-containing protein [Propioniciclava flava]